MKWKMILLLKISQTVWRLYLSCFSGLSAMRFTPWKGLPGFKVS